MHGEDVFTISKRQIARAEDCLDGLLWLLAETGAYGVGMRPDLDAHEDALRSEIARLREQWGAAEREARAQDVADAIHAHGQVVVTVEQEGR